MSDEYAYFRSRCDPKGGEECFPGQKTFSVGIFKWKISPNGSRRRGKAVVRISGSVRNRTQVYKEAERICKLLNQGTYSGPKSVAVTW